MQVSTLHLDGFRSGSAPPIEDHALVGDTRTGALVASDGTVDWMCVPTFDGEPVFGRLVGGHSAGSFRVGPRGAAGLARRRYLPHTATVETTWRTATGELTLSEGMIADVVGRLLPTTLFVRRLTATGGPVEAIVRFDPRLGERRMAPERARRDGELLVCTWGGDRRGPLVLRSARPPAGALVHDHRGSG